MGLFRGFLYRFDRPLRILAATAGLTAVLLNLEFDLLEANLYDFRMVFGKQPATSPDIVLITVDDATSQALGDFPPLQLDYHAKFLEELARIKPKAVGYLINMNQVNQVNPEVFQGEWGRIFIENAKKLELQGTTFVMGTPFDVNGEILPPYPLSALKHAVAIVHKDGNVFSEDKVTRRALTRLYGRRTFHSALAEDAGLVPPGYRPRGSFYVPQVDGEYFFFRYHGKPFITQPGEVHRDTYTWYSFSDVLHRKVPIEKLRDKTLLVGSLVRENPGDFAKTPYPKALNSSPKLVLHANILDSLVRNDGITMAPPWANWLNTFLVTGFVLWWVLHSTPLTGVFATLGLGFIFLALGKLFFHGFGPFPSTWIQESQPLAGIFLGYYLAVPYRLIREYKKRWDYQKKNTLLTQVEELKTNFLSLVTHDLKTPVARIQGLAEVLVARTSDRIAPEDRESLRHIIASTDELNRFISSVLELAKLEGKGVQIRLESKDINHLIERSVEQLRPQATRRNIGIHTHLDPLFPVRIDPSLIAKVFNNLIDNAIKYSRDNSEITITSRELPNGIEVTIRDQGIGISAEDQENLFAKFFRAKDDSMQVRGTGLGLYLSKYFIEAHQGTLSVESVRDQGSAFKIFLPFEAKPGLTVLPARSHPSNSISEMPTKEKHNV